MESSKKYSDSAIVTHAPVKPFTFRVLDVEWNLCRMWPKQSYLVLEFITPKNFIGGRPFSAKT
jgi:hypothetical protein